MSFKNTYREIGELRSFSAGIGRNRLLVQASTGNTSVKVEETLWIKASGTWLRNAERDDIFVAVPISDIRAASSRETEITAPYPTLSDKPLRASIETAMHGVLPYRIVAHVHSINTIAWAVREDAPAQLSQLLSGLCWEWIPYVSSGWRLAREIERALSKSPEANIFVLGNHGLVACGESCAEVNDILLEVERRLAVSPRPGPEPDWRLLHERARDTCWRMPQSKTVHALGTDRLALHISSRGVLYPCQAIFFGEMPLAFTLAQTCSGENGYFSPDAAQRFLILDGTGVLVAESITNAEREILIGFAEVVQRIDTAAPLRYLAESEYRQILNSDTNHYRQLAFAH